MISTLFSPIQRLRSGSLTVKSRAKFARLVYPSTDNLGDEIQTIAAQAFLPSADADVDREALNRFHADQVHSIILNGWYIHKPENWPPSRALNPLLISFHISEVLSASGLKPSEALVRGSGFRYLKEHEPIGARDLHTCELLRSHGINTYFSGCLTLTLKSEKQAQRDGFLAVDVPDNLTNAIERQQGVRISRMTQRDFSTSIVERFEKAEKLLRTYLTAQCVITTRLHCALPCLALGTPVLFIDTQPDKYRFTGLIEYLHSYQADHIARGAYDFRLKNAPENNKSWHKYRDSLIQACERFTGSKHRATL
jgi:Polysaccharide pyruvyl transferase